MLEWMLVIFSCIAPTGYESKKKSQRVPTTKKVRVLIMFYLAFTSIISSPEEIELFDVQHVVKFHFEENKPHRSLVQKGNSCRNAQPDGKPANHCSIFTFLNLKVEK